MNCIPNEIIKNAESAALRDGYDQVIIKQKDDGEYCFSRSYPGCCPEWFGTIVAKIEHCWKNGMPKAVLIRD